LNPVILHPVDEGVVPLDALMLVAWDTRLWLAPTSRGPDLL